METHLTASPEAGKHFYQHFHTKGRVVMLNLLRFKAVADYSTSPELAPATPISGRAAYQLYIDATLPLLAKAGSKLLLQGDSNRFLIGPAHESWDMVLLVEHESVARFMAFAEQEDYQLILGHRTAALADSRLLPISELPV